LESGRGFLQLIGGALMATWLSRHVCARGDHVNKPLLHLVGRASTPGGFGQALSRTKGGTRSSIRPLMPSFATQSITGLVIALFATAAVGATVLALLGAAYDLWLLAEGPLRGAVSEDRTWFGVLPGLLLPRANRPLHKPPVNAPVGDPVLINNVIAAVDVKRLARDQPSGVVSEERGGNAHVVDADEAPRRRFRLCLVQ
jgi:hypothetical protein